MTPQAVLNVDDIQLSDADFWRRPRPEREGAFETLRRERPVAWMPELDDRFLPPGPGFWSITKHADILYISRNPEIFCSGKGATNIPDLPPEFLEFFGSMINMDDPRHKRLRGLISSGFTPARLRKAEEQVRRAARLSVDAVIEKGECDFVTEMAAAFPLRIICEMMGIPESQYDFVIEKTNIILGGGDPEFISEPSEVMPTIFQAGVELAELMKDLRRQRLENPTEDITSVLTHAEVDGESLSEEEMGSFFILLVSAGNETTRNALTHGIHQLSVNPDQKEIWWNDFETVTPTAIEEIVRWGSPVIMMRRTARQDTELRGQPIKEGDKCILWYYSANRDEEAFENPYTFDVRRDPNDHVGFGGPGPHYCLGANLARREMTVMFDEIHRRMPDIEATDEPAYLWSNFINGIKHLPVKFTPGPTSP